MARARAAGRLVLVLVAVTLVAAHLRAQGSPDARGSLQTVIADLHLCGAGLQEWLNRLGVTPGAPVRERLLAVSSTGKVMRALDGTETSVVVTPDFDGDLVREGAGIVLVHNHPTSTSLSEQDLGQLDKAGVAAIVAIGHDGSVYAARRPAGGKSVRRCGSEYYPALRETVGKEVRVELPSLALHAAGAESFSTHLTALALAKAGCVEYFAVMAPDRLQAFHANFMTFGRIVASARATMGK